MGANRIDAFVERAKELSAAAQAAMGTQLLIEGLRQRINEEYGEGHMGREFALDVLEAAVNAGQDVAVKRLNRLFSNAVPSIEPPQSSPPANK